MGDPCQPLGLRHITCTSWLLVDQCSVKSIKRSGLSRITYVTHYIVSSAAALSRSKGPPIFLAFYDRTGCGSRNMPYAYDKWRLVRTYLDRVVLNFDFGKLAHLKSKSFINGNVRFILSRVQITFLPVSIRLIIISNMLQFPERDKTKGRIGKRLIQYP